MSESMLEKLTDIVFEALKLRYGETDRAAARSLAGFVLLSLREPDEGMLRAGEPNDLYGWQAVIDHILNESGFTTPT